MYRSDLQRLRDTELPDYSDDPVRLSPVNSSPPGAPDPSPAGTILLYYYYYYYLFFLSTFAPGAKPTIKIMCLSEDLILNCHARSTSQITADPVFPPADTQTQEMINLPRPGGWLARVFWLPFKWDYTGKSFEWKWGNNINNHTERSRRDCCVVSSYFFSFTLSLSSLFLRHRFYRTVHMNQSVKWKLIFPTLKERPHVFEPSVDR